MKKFYQSKTLWVNLLGAVALFIQQEYGYAIPVETQGYALLLINALLRVITKEELKA